MNKQRSRKRLAVMLFAAGLLLFICIGSAIRTVAENGDEFSHKTLNQAAGNTVTLMAQPGNILDREGTYLAVTKIVYRLILDPKVMQQTEKNYPGSLNATADILAETFDLEKTELLEAFTEDTKSSYLRYKGNTILTEAQVNAYNTAVSTFNEEKKAFNKLPENKEKQMKARIAGVWFEEEYRREYPLGSVLSKTIGYTTLDAQEGIIGLELYYNDILRGENGTSYTYIDGDGNSVTRVLEPENGYNLITSLDANVARRLQEAIAEFDEEVGGERMNVLVMKPKTGEILALASDTDFNLNRPKDLTSLFTEEELEKPEETFLLKEAYKNREDVLESMSPEARLLALRQQVQMNFPVSFAFEPGSTTKGLTLSACIEEGVLQKDETVNCNHEIRIANYIIHCHQDLPCGDLIPIEAFGRSCNVCFVKYGLLLGAKGLAKYQELFNLGQKTGIDLPGEANTESLLYNEDTLTDIDIACNAFGQGYCLTMVQMASAYASLINGGYYYEPHVVTEVRDLEGHVIEEVEPTLVRRTVSTETSEYMKECMRYVVSHGTAGFAKMEGYPLGGKTGAAEKLPRGTGKYIVSFISAAPIEDPEYLIYVTVDEPHVEDQSNSAPAQVLARKCWEKLFDYWNIFPENDEDAYSYDWSRLKDFSELEDTQFSGGIIEDPNGEIDWIQEDETQANLEGVEDTELSSTEESPSGDE